MKRRTEFIMDAKEYCAVTGIISTQKSDIGQMISELKLRDISKKEMIRLLKDTFENLSEAEKILSDFKEDGFKDKKE